jgi:hypothetical protein
MAPEPFTWGDPTFHRYDVGADGDFFFYALLRATSDKHLPSGKGLYVYNIQILFSSYLHVHVQLSNELSGDSLARI